MKNIVNIGKVALTFPGTLYKGDVDINLVPIDSKYAIEKIILSNHFFSLTSFFFEVSYVSADENDEYGFSTIIDLSGDIRKKWESIRGVSSIDENILDEEEKLSIRFLDYISENTHDEKGVVESIIKDMKSNERLIKISNYLNKMRTNLILEIDDITIKP